MTTAAPDVKSATAYYETNIGKATSIQDFVGNYRLLSYALDAYDAPQPRDVLRQSLVAHRLCLMTSSSAPHANESHPRRRNPPRFSQPETLWPPSTGPMT
jgi:hypothetical protein